LAIGSLVMAYHNEKWQRAVVTQRHERPRSYTVRLELTGRCIERNRHLLRAIDPASVPPQRTNMNPGLLFQAKGPQAPLPLLGQRSNNGNVIPVTFGPTTMAPPPDMRNPTPSTSHRTRINSPDTVSRDTSITSPASRSNSPATSPSSSRSYASVVQTPSSGQSSPAPSSRHSSLTPSPGQSTPDQRSSTDTSEESTDDSTPRRQVSSPVPRTRAGRPTRPPDKYSPSKYR
jgi:hypothetical protein